MKIQEIGYRVDCAPAWHEFPKYNRIPVETVTKGSKKLYTGFKVPTGKYWIGSDTVMEESFCPDGEIVDVVSNRMGWAYLLQPIQRTWHGPGLLIQAPILRNVVFDGGSGPLSCCLIDGLTIKNWKVDGYETRGISIQSCRNVTVENYSVSNPKETGPGEGYGCQVQRCTNVRVEGVGGVANRHLVTVFASANTRVADCKHLNPQGASFDTHGFGEEDIEFDSCDFGGSDFPIGNRFLWGSKRVTARNCTGIQDVFAYGNTEDAWLENIKARRLRCFTNQAGSPISATALGCKFDDITFENGSIDRLTLLNPVW